MGSKSLEMNFEPILIWVRIQIGRYIINFYLYFVKTNWIYIFFYTVFGAKNSFEFKYEYDYRL